MSYKSSIYAYAIGHYDKNGYEKYKVGCVKNACPHKRIQDELKETLASGFIPNKILNCSFKTKKIFEDESKLFQELNKSHDITKMLNKEHFTGKNLNLEFKENSPIVNSNCVLSASVSTVLRCIIALIFIRSTSLSKGLFK